MFDSDGSSSAARWYSFAAVHVSATPVLNLGQQTMQLCRTSFVKQLLNLALSSVQIAGLHHGKCQIVSHVRVTAGKLVSPRKPAHALWPLLMMKVVFSQRAHHLKIIRVALYGLQ